MNQQLLQDWNREGIELNPPARIEKIKYCEMQVGFEFPEDFVKFYTSAGNGFKNNQIDDKLLMLWSLDRIISDKNSGEFIPFADYMINSSQIGFIKNRQGIYKNNEIWLICESFTDFLEHWKRESGEYM